MNIRQHFGKRFLNLNNSACLMLQFLRKLLVRFLQWLLGDKTEAMPGTSPPSYPDAMQASPAPVNVLAVMAVDPPQYRARKSLCTYSERVFYEALRESVGNEYLIMVKVRMGDILWLENKTVNEKLYTTQIWGKHVDFLLCDKLTLAPLLVVELDDSGHNRFYRREVDEFKDKAFAIAGLPLLRVEVQDAYQNRELRQQILGKIEK